MAGNTNANGGFNLIANPYAAPISWTKLYATNTNITKYFTYFDPKLNAGSYVTVDNTGVTSNLSSTATVDIQSGEAFFIQASSATPPAFTIAETAKSSNNNITIFRATSVHQTFYTRLFIDDSIGRRNADGVLNQFDPNYNNNVDNNDAPELENFNENIAISRLGQHLSIEQRMLPVNHPDTIPLYMSNMNIKNYDLQFNIANINQSITAQLVDKFTGIKSDLSLDTATIVPFSVSSNAASKDTNRFYILLNPLVALPLHLLSFDGSLKNEGVQLQWLVNDEINFNHFEIERSFTQNNFEKIGNIIGRGNTMSNNLYEYFDANPKVGNNYYRLKMIDKYGKISYSKICTVNFPELLSSIMVYPNPVTGNIITVKLNNIPKGNYLVALSDKNGRLFFNKIFLQNNNPMYSFKLDKKLTPGLYSLNIGKYKTSLIYLRD